MRRDGNGGEMEVFEGLRNRKIQYLSIYADLIYCVFTDQLLSWANVPTPLNMSWMLQHLPEVYLRRTIGSSNPSIAKNPGNFLIRPIPFNTFG